MSTTDLEIPIKCNNLKKVENYLNFHGINSKKVCKTIQILQNILDTLIRKFYVINKRTKLQHQTKRELFHNYYSKLWTFSCFFLMKNLREKWACGIYGNVHYSPIICIIFHFFFDVSSWGNLKYLKKSSSKITSFKWVMK